MRNSCDVLRIGVIGCGHWGPNHIRVFSQLKECKVVAVVDADESRLTAVCANFPNVRGFSSHQEMLQNADLDAVVVATPTDSHTTMVEAALAAGKHILCEKPLCVDPFDGQKLVHMAKARRLVLMVGHVFLFNAGLLKVKELMDAGEIGSCRYLSAIRTNLGPVRSDVNAAYDLASHDISVFNWLLGTEPLEVRAMGAAFLRPNIEDVVVIVMRYPRNVLASIHCSWLDPKKVRQLTIVGSQRMITWDDLALSSPVAVYEKSIEMNKEVADYGEFLRLSMLDGDVRLPKVETVEPLRAQAITFVRAVRDGVGSHSDGDFGLGVVRVLHAVGRSLKQNGVFLSCTEIQ